MKHYIKSTIFKTLSLLPNKISYILYHKIQSISGKSNIQTKINSSKKSFDSAINILKKTKISISNRNMIEIGSGWLPIMPYYFKYYGKVNRVDTYDLNKHYQKKEISKLNNYFKKLFKLNISINSNSKYNLPKFVNYYPKKNLLNIHNIKNDDTQFVFSRNVLEHISPLDIIKIHENLSEKMKNQYYILHMISPSDHRAYSDKKLSHYDFLKYSQSEWDNIQTKFDYHNRLRLPQYIEIFKNLNYEILYISHDTCEINSEKYKKFKKLVLHEDYRKFKEDEILAGTINILLKSKN